MILNLKRTILFSTSIAAALNVGQFFASYHQREVAFIPAWAQAASHPAASPSPAPTANLAAAKTISPAASPAAAAPLVVAADASAATIPPANSNSVAAKLSAAGLKPTYAALYLTVQNQTGTPWQLLAAVHEVETGQSGTTSRTSPAGAVGPMQFMPATFARYAADGNGDGIIAITNLDDAMLTAGRYLAASGAATGDWSAALYHYNHSDAYVSRVLGLAYKLGI